MVSPGASGALDRSTSTGERDRGDRFDRWLRIAILLVVAGAVVARFLVRSPLWLDEALSASIAGLPIGELPTALAQDGHPPAYYAALHLWMEAFGVGDVAVRAFSALWSVLAVVLGARVATRLAGPRAGWCAALVLAASPYMVRYGSEARMYAMVSALVLAGWLLALRLWHEPSRWRWSALAGVTAVGVLTHYWVLYAVAVGAAIALVGGRRGNRRGAWRVLSALAAGTGAFVAWLPTFLDQLAHTGTPWGTAPRPTVAVVDLITALGGARDHAEAILFGFAIVALVGVALTLVIAERADGSAGAGAGDDRLVLSLRGAPGVRAEVVFATGVLAIGSVVGLLTDAPFEARYGAASVPLLLVAAAVGLARAPRRLAVPVGVVLIGLASVGIGRNSLEDRTQGGAAGAAIAAAATGEDLVVLCPDQLGPSVVRSLGPSIEAVAVGSTASPERVDWRDYADRNRALVAADEAADLLARGAGRTIWFVYQPGYRTYGTVCEEVGGALVAARGTGAVVLAGDPEIYEPANVVRFDP